VHPRKIKFLLAPFPDGHGVPWGFRSVIELKVVVTFSSSHSRKDTGLDRFVPASLAESMKRKELRKLLSHFLKLSSSPSSPSGGEKHLTALQAKLHYLKIISDLPSYGAKCFSTNISVSLTKLIFK
jgi:hypothetical protein